MKKSSHIALSVLFAHLLALIWMSANYSPQTIKKHGPLAIRTFREVPRKVVPVQSKTPPKASAPAAKPKKVPPAPEKKSSKKAPAKPTKEIPKKPKEIEESSLAVTAPTPPSIAADVKLPSILQTHQTQPLIEEEGPLRSSDYSAILADMLQFGLGQLPEFGNVRASLTLNASGQVALVEILQADSDKNAEWLKKQLLLLELPCFNDFGIADANLTFTIMFRNAEPL